MSNVRNILVAASAISALLSAGAASAQGIPAPAPTPAPAAAPAAAPAPAPAAAASTTVDIGDPGCFIIDPRLRPSNDRFCNEVLKKIVLTIFE